MLALLGMILWKPSHLLQGVLAGQERFKSVATLNAAAAVLAAGVGLAALAFGGGLAGYMGISALVAAAVGIAAWRLSGFRFRPEIWNRSLMERLVRGGMPYLGWNLVRRVYGDGDRILLGFLST